MFDDVPFRSLATLVPIKPGLSLSAEWLKSYIQGHLADDDVFQSDFLSGIVFYGATQSQVKVSDNVRSIFPSSWKTSWFRFRASDQDDPLIRQGPYILENKTLRQAWRLYDDAYNIFMVSLRPSLEGLEALSPF